MGILFGGHAAQNEQTLRGYRWLWTGVVNQQNVGSIASISQRIMVRQELPDHPRSNFGAGIQGPNVRVPVRDAIIIGQEQPFHPRSVLTRGHLLPVAPRPPGTDTILLQQELPDHPRSNFGAGIQGPNVRVPVRDTIMLRQEMPGHPGNFFLPYPPPTPAVPAFRRALMQGQYAPWHPGSMFFAGNTPLEFEDRQFFIIL